MQMPSLHSSYTYDSEEITRMAEKLESKVINPRLHKSYFNLQSRRSHLSTPQSGTATYSATNWAS